MCLNFCIIHLGTEHATNWFYSSLDLERFSFEHVHIIWRLLSFLQRMFYCWYPPSSTVAGCWCLSMMIFAWQSGYCYLLFPAQLPATLRCFILNRSSQNNLQETLFSLTLNNEFFPRKINYRARRDQNYFTLVAVTEFEFVHCEQAVAWRQPKAEKLCSSRAF